MKSGAPVSRDASIPSLPGLYAAAVEVEKVVTVCKCMVQLAMD